MERRSEVEVTLSDELLDHLYRLSFEADVPLRWLVAGLTFQLAADILLTAITTSWEEVGRLAAIAAIRTLLNYFLERDLSEFRERQDGVARSG